MISFAPVFVLILIIFIFTNYSLTNPGVRTAARLMTCGPNSPVLRPYHLTRPGPPHLLQSYALSMADPGPSSGRKPFFMSLRRLRSPSPIPGLPFMGPHTSNFTSAMLASSTLTQPGAVMTLASTNITVPSLAYGLSYVLWLLHLTSNPFLGRFNGIQVTHPSSQVNGVLSARIDTRIKLCVTFRPGFPVQFLKIPRTPSVHKQCPTPEGSLKFSVELKGAGSQNIISNVCEKCKERKDQATWDIVDFRAATTIIPIEEDGTASIEFFIRCYAHHHGTTNFW